jgi:two-component system NtrC family sensor kinase
VHGFLRVLAQAAAPLVSGLVVSDAEDRTAAASYEYPARPSDLSDRDYLRALRAGAEVAIGEVVEARPMGWRLFGVARRRAEGGAVISSFSPDAFTAFYATIVETPEDTVTLLRADGAVLARHPPLPRDTPAGPNREVAAMLGRLQEGAEMSGGPAPLAGGDRLYAARQVGDYPVVVAYGLSSEAMHAAWRQRMLPPLFGGVAAAGLLLLLTWLAQQGARRLIAAAENRREAEAQLARAGRSAAIGLLAAGLAHDVKNLVQAVRSGARLMHRNAADPGEIRRCADLLAEAAERGGRLVDSMLQFARGRDDAGGTPDLDVARALGELKPLLDRTLGSLWTIHLVAASDMPRARGDRSGFEAAVVNLAVNARDAMPSGGIVTISAWVEELSEAQPDLEPGRYVVAGITDAGGGMDAETLERAGEPFFTTKPPGHGTGLGLATVRGFATRTGGSLRLESAPGQGTTAAIWLPAAE